MLCVLKGEHYPPTYTNPWSVWRRYFRKPPGAASECRHATARASWAQAELVVVRAHLGCCHTLGGPSRHRLALVSCWLGLDGYHIGARPRFVDWMGLCLVLWCRICVMLSRLFIVLCFPLVFKCVLYKTCFFQYKWNYVKSKCICVKSLFISPILDSKWWSDIIVKHR